MVEQLPFDSITKIAEQDLRSFFLECTEPKSLQADRFLQNIEGWNQRCKSIYGKINDKIKKEQIEGNEQESSSLTYINAIDSLEDLLFWLEERKAALKWPWVKGNIRRELEDHDIFALLNSFKKTFLDGLCTPSRGTSPQPNNWLLRRFLEFVGWNGNLDGKQWHVIAVPLPPTGGPVVPVNFTSWLSVAPTLQTLYIQYNKVAINFGVDIKDDRKRITRQETVFLHELGHAVSNLEWFKDKLEHFDDPENRLWCITDSKGNKWVGAPASHEFGAWAYAFAIRGWVKSIRSWIRRLVEEKDDELLNL